MPETGAGVDLQDQLEILIQEFRTSEPPMPVFVVHAQDGSDDEAVAGLVQQLYEGQEAHGTRCAVAQDVYEGDSEVRRAAAMVRALSDPKKWGGRTSVYRRYAFPRLRLVHAIDDAVRTLGDSWPAPGRPASDQGRRQLLLDQLAAQRWRPEGTARWRSGLPLFDMAHILPASLVTVLAALLARSAWYVAAAAGLGFLALLTVLNYALPGRAPIFLWLRRESRWFMTTTFLRAADQENPTEVSLLRPVRSWRAIAARAYDVAEALTTGGDFHLQLCVLALREDLRDNHRRLSWDLRGFKRPRPPVLFLPHADEANGGLELIRAVSDVRSRRSELDPLLVFAAVREQDVPRLDHGGTPPVPAPGPQLRRLSDRLRTWHREWGQRLRAEQSPSRDRSVLPWVMKIPLPHDQLDPIEERRVHLRASTRPTFARMVWALHSLVLVVALVAAATIMRAEALDDRYCSASLLTANRDTRREPAPGGGTECIGLATKGVRFSDWLPKPAAGADAKPLSAGDEPPWTVAELEQGIAAQNEDVLTSYADDYVTVVYAGPLSADHSQGTSLVKGAEELAGVYLAQAVINKNYTVKLRVLLANGGVDLGHQTDMAESIAAYAAHDPSVVGVVGTGRDLESSGKTTDILMKAGLPIVSGTNSATYLPRQYANWFSLAATDEWQTRQMGLIAAQLRTPGKRQYALVLARDTARTDDRYTEEQARYGQRMLADRGFTLLGQRRYTLKGGKPELREHAEEICSGDRIPSVVYFAGRAEDVEPLMTQLSAETGCSEKPLAILTGDDLSKVAFTGGKDAVAPAPDVTLYHAALAELKKAATRTSFYVDAADHLPGLAGRTLSYDSPVLASGQTALAHDATRALYYAATPHDTPQSRAATWVNLRTVRIEGMATGTIDFTGAPLYGDRTGQSIVLKEVHRTADGTSETHVVCSRIAGDTRPLTLKECAIRRPK
ncbi:ABC transporter substrate-binding protein [Streptomyces sp. NBC_00201]|uniref:ABC transporter substrate-binding protein n=1 Tax=Streptomyces sp. NBC_00201 TaxID=2975679 RepID=UPI00225B2961|nr:ABC transporter substrate-binding protein [Streptomyces sp. NBC_00201]MCX5249665.1 ABC transporter substrate-binding protein [Streptomyces sp. NBC_00201]